MKFIKTPEQLPPRPTKLQISQCTFGEVYQFISGNNSRIPVPPYSKDPRNLRLCVEAGGKKYLIALHTGAAAGSTANRTQDESAMYLPRPDVKLTIEE